MNFTTETFRIAVRAMREMSGVGKVDFDKKTKSHQPWKTSRLWLALHLVGYARWTSFLPNKIAFYCSALEALLSTSQAELAHQIAERVTVLLPIEISKLETYRILKKCYSIRSKYIHGDVVKADENYVADMSAKLDSLVRDTFRSVLADEEIYMALEDNNKLDELMLRRLLGDAGLFSSLIFGEGFGIPASADV